MLERILFYIAKEHPIGSWLQAIRQEVPQTRAYLALALLVCSLHTCFSVVCTIYFNGVLGILFELVCYAHLKWCTYCDFVSTLYSVCCAHLNFYSVEMKDKTDASSCMQVDWECRAKFQDHSHQRLTIIF